MGLLTMWRGHLFIAYASTPRCAASQLGCRNNVELGDGRCTSRVGRFRKVYRMEGAAGASQGRVEGGAPAIGRSSQTGHTRAAGLFGPQAGLFDPPSQGLLECKCGVEQPGSSLGS